MNTISDRATMRGAEWAGVVAAASAAVLVVMNPEHQASLAIAGASLLFALSWIALVDLRHWIIPDGAVVAVVLLGGGWRLAAEEGIEGSLLSELLRLAVDGLVWGGALFLLREAYFRRRGIDGLGMGDVKLAFACAILNGTAGFAWALLLASVGGLLSAAVISLRGERLTKIPFGAFLAPASGLIWLAGWSG